MEGFDLEAEQNMNKDWTIEYKKNPIAQSFANFCQKAEDDMKAKTSRGGVPHLTLSSNAMQAFDSWANVVPKVSSVDIGLGEDKASYEISIPDFEKIKADLVEKYKLTPADEQQNRAVKRAKEWGTNNNVKFITPYSKAIEAGEEYAYLLMDDSDKKDFDPSSVLTLMPLTLTPWGSASVKDVVKEFSTKEELKQFLKENDIDVAKDLKEDTVVEIIDKFPDFFEDTELSFTEKEEKRVENRPMLMRDKIFKEFPMEPAVDSIKYIRPVYNVNAPTSLDMDVDGDLLQSLADACSVPKDFLFDTSEPEPVKEKKLSWKQQQRMRKNNPMWKPNC